MDLLLSILSGAGLVIIGVLLFELIIFFHEGGHFVCAKLSGVKVNEFALGMGPKLFSFTKDETTYSLRIFPIGGFCAMEGEDEDSENPRAFNNAKIYKRLIIIVAGAIMNIVFGVILMTILLLPNEYFIDPTITDFSPKAYSASCGLMEGDKFYKVNDYRILNNMDFSYALAKLKSEEVDGSSVQIYKQDCANALCDTFVDLASKGVFENMSDEEYIEIYSTLEKSIDSVNKCETKQKAYEALEDGVSLLVKAFPDEDITLPEITEKDTRVRYRTDVVVIRNGEKVTLNDVDFFTYTTAESDDPKMSVDFYLTAKDKNPLTFLGQVSSQTVSVVRMVVDSLVGLLQGEFSFRDVSGPIGVTSATVEVAKEGLKTGFFDAVLNIVYIMMVISINLGVVNMLPFPALDGGRFVFLIIEAIFKKPIPRKVEGIVNVVGLAVLLLFSLIVSVKDVWQLFV